MQTAVVIVILLLSMAYALWRLRNVFATKSDPCEGCAGCAMKGQKGRNDECDKKN